MIVVGGFNSSNTSHLVELCEDAGLPTYFISDASEMTSPREIHHFDWREKEERTSSGWLPVEKGSPVEVLLTAGASCPDALLDEVGDLARRELCIEPVIKGCEQLLVFPQPAVQTPAPANQGGQHRWCQYEALNNNM